MSKQEKDRIICSVSINDIDHPYLYAAIKFGDVQKSVFPNASYFLGKCAEEKLESIHGEPTTTIEDKMNDIEKMLVELIKKMDHLMSNNFVHDPYEDDLKEEQELRILLGLS